MHPKFKALKSAFPYTIPVLTGYIFLGIAFGILLSSKGYHFGWAILMSCFIYAGSMQFVAINLLVSTFNPLNAFLITLVVNARHIFYGISLLKKYKGQGSIKPYLIFGLTDETYSLICSTNPPKDVDERHFMFLITLLNHSYWIIGSALGAILGSIFTFNTHGIDFVMTALFVVIFIDQWKAQNKHVPALIGLGSSAACLLLLGPDKFIIPSMICILLFLTVFKKNIEREA